MYVPPPSLGAMPAVWLLSRLIVHHHKISVSLRSGVCVVSPVGSDRFGGVGWGGRRGIREQR